MGAKRGRGPCGVGKHESLGCQYRGSLEVISSGPPLLHFACDPERKTSPLLSESGAEMGQKPERFQDTLPAPVGVPFPEYGRGLFRPPPRAQSSRCPPGPPTLSPLPPQSEPGAGGRRSLGSTIRGERNTAWAFTSPAWTRAPKLEQRAQGEGPDSRERGGAPCCSPEREGGKVPMCGTLGL